MKVIFKSGYFEHDDALTIEKGHRSDVLFLDDNLNYYEVNFITIQRLTFELGCEESLGKNYITDVGLIILGSVTKENIITALRELNDSKFFENFKAKQNIKRTEEWTEFDI